MIGPKVNIVLTYQRNGQVKFRDFGLEYTSNPVGKTNTCFNNIEPNKKKTKRIKRQPPANANVPAVTCVEVGSTPNDEITIKYGPFEIDIRDSINAMRVKIEAQFRALFQDLDLEVR